jgi:hypothetical protein
MYKIARELNVRDRKGKLLRDNLGLTLDKFAYLKRFRDRPSVADRFNAPGVIYYQPETNRLGQERMIGYKITFSHADKVFEKKIRDAFANELNPGKISKFLTKANRFQGAFHTKLKATFSPLAAFKDYGERLFNITNRAYLTKDGKFLDGWQVAKGMLKLMGNVQFWSSYMKWRKAQFSGKPMVVENSMDQLIDDFEKSGSNWNTLSFFKMDKALTSPLTKGNRMSAIRNVLYQSKLVRAWASAGKAIDWYNDNFNAAPVLMNYIALRDLNVAKADAASGAVDVMNFSQAGTTDPIGSAIMMFFRPAMQGGFNMLRSLNPWSTVTKAQRYRGALMFGGLVLSNMMLITFLRAMAGENDEGENLYDARPFSTTSRSMLFFMPDGSQFKGPVPFGAPGASWGVGDALLRYSNGNIDATELAYNLFISFQRQMMPDSSPAYKPGGGKTLAWVAQTTSPQILRGFVDVLINKDHWGSEISRGSNKEGLREFEKGNTTTPIAWHRAAKALYPWFDTTPESLRYLFNHYMFGGLHAAIVVMDSDKLIAKSYPSTDETLGIPASLIGLNSLYATASNTNQAAYFSASNRLDDELRSRGVKLTNRENETGDKPGWIRKTMREGGFSPAEIRFALLREDVEKDIEKAREEFNNKHKDKLLSDEAFDYENIRRESETMVRKIDKARAKLVKFNNQNPFTTF